MANQRPLPDVCLSEYDGEIIFETGFYRVVVETALDSRSAPVLIYNTYNKNTGVIEIQSRSLPEVLGLTFRSQKEAERVLHDIKMDVDVTKVKGGDSPIIVDPANVSHSTN